MTFPLGDISSCVALDQVPAGHKFKLNDQQWHKVIHNFTYA